MNMQQQIKRSYNKNAKLATTMDSVNNQRMRQNGKVVMKQKNEKPAIPETKIGVKRKSETISAGKNIETPSKRRLAASGKLTVVKNANSIGGNPQKQQQKSLKKEVKVAATANKTTKQTVPIQINKNSDFNPLDNILNEIDAFDTTNKPKKKRQKAPKIESPIETEEGTGPCSSQQLPSTTIPNSMRPLNRMELQRQEQDNTMVQLFLHRDDLMERILAYKMVRGRVESYLTMKAKIDLNSCIIPEYEIRPDLVDPISALLHPKFEPFMKEEPQTTEIDPPRTHQSMQGPMTPPGSPGTNQSSTGGLEHHHHGHRHYQHSQEGPSGTAHQAGKLQASNSNEEMLRKFGALIGVPEERIRSLLGDDFEKIGSLKTEEWLETFRDSLKHLAGKKEQGGVFKSPDPSTSQIKDETNSLLDSTGPNQLFNQFQRQNVAHKQNTVSDVMEAAMDISSESSRSSSSSGLFLPPPPAPPPMLPPPPSNPIILEPPTPPPPITDENATFKIDDEPIPPPPPPIMLPNDEPSTSHTPPVQPPTIPPNKPTRRFQIQRRFSNVAIRKQRKLPNQQGGLTIRNRKGGIQQGNNNRMMRNARSLKQRAALENPHNQGGGQQMEALMRTACARPISLLSLDIKAPAAKQQSLLGVSRNASAEEVQQSNNLSHPSIQIEQGIPPPQFNPKLPPNQNQMHQKHHPIQNEANRSNAASYSSMPPSETSMMNLSMHFIKNTPPPPIPDIIRKQQLPNRTENQASTIPVASTSMSQTPPPRPQKLLSMDLITPSQPHHIHPLSTLMRPPLPIYLPPPNLAIPPPRTPNPPQLMPFPTPHRQRIRLPLHQLAGPIPPNPSAILKTVVQAIGTTNSKEQQQSKGRSENNSGKIASSKMPTAAIASSPYGKFF